MGPLRLFGWPIRACVLLVLIAPSGTGEEPKAPQYGPEVQKRLDALRARGEPVTLEDLTPEPIPPEENAATIYRQAFAAWVGPTEEVAGYLRWHPHLWGDQQREALRAWVLANGDAARLAALAARREACQFPESQPLVIQMLGASSVEESDAFRVRRPVFRLAQLGWVLQASGHLHLSAGEVRTASEECLTLLRMCEPFEQEGGLDSIAAPGSVATLANDLLSSAEAQVLDLRAFSEVISRLRESDCLVSALKVQRVWWLATHPLARTAADSPLRRPFEKDVLTLLEGLEDIIALADKPWHATSEERKALEVWRRHSMYQEKVPAADLLWVASRSLLTRAERQAWLDEMALGIELEMHRRAAGSYPDALDDVKLTHLDELPVDPFTGRPLVYKRKEAGYTLYSLGPNGKDDGGKYDRDQGFDDIVWAVNWPRELRREE